MNAITIGDKEIQWESGADYRYIDIGEYDGPCEEFIVKPLDLPSFLAKIGRTSNPESISYLIRELGEDIKRTRVRYECGRFKRYSPILGGQTYHEVPVITLTDEEKVAMKRTLTLFSSVRQALKQLLSKNEQVA